MSAPAKPKPNAVAKGLALGAVAASGDTWTVHAPGVKPTIP